MNSFREFLYDGEVIGLYLNRTDMKISEIASQYGKSQADVYRILHQNGIRPNRLKTGHEAVLSLSSRGWGVPEIANITGYTERNVRYIIAKRLND